MGEKKFLVIIFALLLFFPALVIASNFNYVKSIKVNSNAEIISIETGTSWFDISNFSETRSAAKIILRNSSGTYELDIFVKNIGKLTVGGRNITATVEADYDGEVACSQFDENGVMCSGNNLEMSIRAPRYRWNGTAETFAFEIEGGLLGFGDAEIVGYNSSDDEILHVALEESNYYFTYSRHSPSSRARSTLENGQGGSHAEWVNTPTTGLGDSGILFDFNNFTETYLKGRGYITRSSGFGGRIALNLQGELDVAGTNYTVRNEIYLNLNRLQYNDCPIFNSTSILCYIRSGYIHTYIPSHEDITLWKTFPEVFVFEIIDDKATITAGETSEDDLFRISDIDVVNFKFS